MMATGLSVDEPIVAVSSPPGRSLRGLVRVSGRDIGRIIEAMTGIAREQFKARELRGVRVRSGAMPALACYFAGPHSYTGQDLFELQVPGNPALLDRLIHEAIAAGARLAQAGEFTFRAFVAGKINLIEAEGIAATISATSEGQLKAAELLRSGRLGGLASELVEQMAHLLALVEAGIDFTDQEDVVSIGPGELDEGLSQVVGRLDSLLTNSRSWGALDALPGVVLAGAPSAGKSTLFNALLGRERAVISAMPGTTRDVLTEPLELETERGQRVEAMLVDMAGLDRPEAALDEKIQEAAQRALQGADLVVEVIDARGGRGRRIATVEVPSHVPLLVVQTKADVEAEGPREPGVICVSGKTGRNLDVLRKAICDCLGDRAVSVRGEMLALQPRHESALRGAERELLSARALLEPQLHSSQLQGAELVAGRMRLALDELAGLGGQMTPDDVIGRVFATFCVGK
jgi:tRNA modification GTPase